MALSSAIQWDVQTGGASTNGGGFKAGASGTDYSQQTSPQWALTGLATAGAGSTFLYASAADTMVGNVCQVISGTNFTTGFFEITSVSVGVSVTVDRAICTGIGANGVINIGGCVDHPNTISTVVVGSNIVWIASGTYAKVGANTYILSQTVNSVTWIGYITNHSTIAYGTDRPLFDGTGATNGMTGGVSGSVMKNIRFATSTNGATCSLNNNWVFENCKFSGHTTGITTGNYDTLNLFSCEIASCTTAINSSMGVTAINCYSHNNTNAGFSFGSNYGYYFLNCISANNGGHGFASSGGGSNFNAIGCIAYGNTGGSSDGFNFAVRGNWAMINCIASANGRYGFNMPASYLGLSLFDYNCYYGNGTAGLNGGNAGPHDTTSNPKFNSPTTGDFTLQAGSSCLNVGFPQTTMAGATI